MPFTAVLNGQLSLTASDDKTSLWPRLREGGSTCWLWPQRSCLLCSVAWHASLCSSPSWSCGHSALLDEPTSWVRPRMTLLKASAGKGLPKALVCWGNQGGHCPMDKVPFRGLSQREDVTFSFVTDCSGNSACPSSVCCGSAFSECQQAFSLWPVC